MGSKKSTAAIVFVTGSDEASVKRVAAETASRLAPGADAFGLEVIDGGVETVDAAVSRTRDAMQALATLPFLGGTKLVWLKNVSFLADSVTGRSESVGVALEQLCDLLDDGLPEGVTFLCSAVAPDKRRSVYKRLAKSGQLEVHDKPTLSFGAGEEEIIAWVGQQTRKAGLDLEGEAVELLAARVGLEPSQLFAEIDKLALCGRRITARDVRELVPATRESGIFDLGNAIFARDLEAAMDTLGQLFYQGEKGVGILLASIVPTVRNLMLAKFLLVRHKLRPPAAPQYFSGDLARLPASETDYLPRKKDGTLNAYGLGVAAKAAARFELETLQAAFRACAEANRLLISSQGDEKVILSRLLITLLGEPPAARAQGG